mmetsp:Transcript_19399/g.65938  ORF Transcript_19399/g.65938 Transcript_19399/m.65938 type:complete len:344 (+) Transcript_19399:1132-2163(+)
MMRPGTYIFFLISLSPSALATSSTAAAAARASSWPHPLGSSTVPFTFPLTCTAIVSVSFSTSLGSNSGHGAYVSDSALPILSHSSSARCGAYGASSSTKGSSAARGRFSHLVAAFTNSIIAEIPVLKRMFSTSSVTLPMHRCTSLSCSLVGSSSLTPRSTSRYDRARKRCTPSTLLVDHVLVSVSGPMNISYRRSESAPKRSTTSSGFTTLPLLLLILYARAATSTEGSALRTYPVPFFSTSSAPTFTAVAPSAPSPHHAPAPSLNAVYSVSPRIMPWLTSFWKGSFVDTTPMSYSTLCQKRAYSRCSTACSAPPTYRSTGIQYFSTSGSMSMDSLSGSMKRR